MLTSLCSTPCDVAPQQCILKSLYKRILALSTVSRLYRATCNTSCRPGHPPVYSRKKGLALALLQIWDRYNLCAGDAWEIERCNCEWSKSTGCESISSDHLLWGYGEFREGGAGAHVPIAPAQCCRACVGDQVHSMEKCRSLNHCSRRGVCVRLPSPLTVMH